MQRIINYQALLALSEEFKMNKLFKLSVLLCVSLPMAQALAFDHRTPVPFDKLPKECQHYFKRAEACYHKANMSDKKAQFAQRGTIFLQQALPAATAFQRVQMCQVAERDFPARVKSLNCE